MGSFGHEILRCDGAGLGYVREWNRATALGNRDEA